jgi:hypothetical protein
MLNASNISPKVEIWYLSLQACATAGADGWHSSSATTEGSNTFSNRAEETTFFSAISVQHQIRGLSP